MGTLAELILKRDKERERRRSHCTTPRTSDVVAAQKQPAHGEVRFLLVYDITFFWHTIVRILSRALRIDLNLGFQCIHYLMIVQ